MGLAIATVLAFIAAVLAQASDQPLANPWIVGGGSLGVAAALVFLGIKLFRVTSDQYLVASKQAQELVKPLHDEIGRLRSEIAACERQSVRARLEAEAERTWSRILVERLSDIIRADGLSIPEGTWVRPESTRLGPDI